MTQFGSIEIKKLIAEIQVVEASRATKLRENTFFAALVNQFREKYIVKGFLTPLYARGGRWGRVMDRIGNKEKVGSLSDFILPENMISKTFTKEGKDWIHNEELFFWDYLIQGQDFILGPNAPDSIRIDGRPAEKAWKEITTISEQMNLFGESGGGLINSSEDLSEESLGQIEALQDWIEEENGYALLYESSKNPHWINLLQRYRSIEISKQLLEFRPAWYHITNYVFFNKPIERLPAFCAIFAPNSRLKVLSFLDQSLSESAQRLIFEVTMNIHKEFETRTNTKVILVARRNLRWWLWHNVGHGVRKRTQSYQEIANLENSKRSTVQFAIVVFENKLKKGFDGRFLGKILRYGLHMGLGHDMVYNKLADRGIVPKRERGIDGFDDLDALI